MTREALDKLNDKQMNYCKVMSALIARSKEKGLTEEFERCAGKLRGFLECLCQMGVITGIELRVVYMWFLEKDRSEEE